MGIETRALTNLARAASAGPGDVVSLLGRMCASIAETLGASKLEPVLEGFPEDSTGVATWAEGELLIPLISADGPVGCLRGRCETEPELELAAACGALVAASVQRALEYAELERLGLLKSQFIALASHELRTPAAVVHGIAKTVEAHGDDLPPDELAKLRAMLCDHTERLTRMLEDLLDLSRLDAKAIKIEPTRVDVREKIEEVVASIAGERAGEVGIEVEPGLCPLVDPRALDRILGNLVANALNYGEGPVRIKAAQNDRHFRLSVEDAGEGVAPAFVPQLFDRFSRGNHGADDGGSGLGLSIAQSYARAHGGQLFYEDASPHGARFQLVLPSPH